MKTIGTAKIEFNPQNGHSPHVVRCIFDGGPNLWFAYRTREEAEEKLDKLAWYCPKEWGDELQVIRP